jgi:AcrR family transcriptional regulator
VAGKSEGGLAGRQVNQSGDLETHARVLNAAARLFAANGFKHVTVREICASAAANVAAVNYHFGDKLELYRQVLARAIDTMCATTDAAKRAGLGGPPEHKLRTYIGVFLRRVSTRGHDSWIHQMMAHEIADPTPALDLVVEQVIRPRLGYLCEIVGEMIGRPADDPIVMRCVLSIQAQCHAAMPNAMARRVLPEMPTDRPTIEALADHIARFSLAGIRAVAEAAPATVKRR